MLFQGAGLHMELSRPLISALSGVSNPFCTNDATLSYECERQVLILSVVFRRI